MESHEPLRICHFASGDLWAGAEVQVATLIRALKRFPQLEISALLLNNGRLAEVLSDADIPVTIFDESQLGIGQLLRSLIAYLNRVRPHILHSHRYKEHTLGAFAGKMSHNPIMIQTYHGLEENLPGLAGFKLRGYSGINWLVGRAVAHGAVGVSSEIATILRQRFPAADVRCIRNGIDVESARPTVSRGVMREKLGLAEDVCIVGTVCRLTPIKGIDYLIEAVALLRQHSSQHKVKLVIVGDGPLRGSLEQAATVRGLEHEVIFLGMRSDVYDVMAAFDIFALPSLHEGIPMVLLEAMAIGVPIVASKVGGIPEILHDGREAFLVQAKNSEALAGRIGELAESEEMRERISRAARERVESELSIHTAATRMYEMYASLSCSCG